MGHRAIRFHKLLPQDREQIQKEAVTIWRKIDSSRRPFEEIVTAISPVSGKDLQIACRFTNRGVEEASTRYPIRNCSRL